MNKSKTEKKLGFCDNHIPSVEDVFDVQIYIKV